MDVFSIRIALLIWGSLTLIVRSIYVRRARRRKAQEGSSHINPHPLVLAAMSLWIGLLMVYVAWPDALLDDRFLLFTPTLIYLQALGLGGLIVGLWLFIQAHEALGEFYGVKLYIKEAHRVIDVGPYAYIRHPMYTIYMFWLFSSLLFLPHYAIVCFLLMALVGFYRMAKGEEKMLCQALGKSYEKYVAQTGMFLPKWLEMGK